MSLRSESKGSSARRGHCSSSVPFSSPSRAAATTRAASVGSPPAAGSRPARMSAASLQSAPMVRASARSPVRGVQTSTTVIRFWVRVPVLSEQITPAQPRVSTAGRRLTMAPRLTIRWTPSASTMVTMAGSPSGMAATARDTAVMNIPSRALPWSRPAPNITAHTHRHTKERVLEISAIFFWSGVWLSSSPSSIPAMRPISVSMPVAVITQRARPPVTTVPESTIFRRSARGVSSGSSPTGALAAGTGSPVMALSSQRSPAAVRMRASAGTRSPASS